MSDQITTAAGLDALPSGTIVQVVDDPTAPNSFWLYGTGGLWWTFAAEHGYTSAEMAEDWAFTVLYRPDAPARTEPVTAATAYDLGVKEGLRLSRTKPAKEDEIAEAACRSSDYTLEGVTLAQDAAEASLQLAEPMMDAAAGILADDKNSAELPTRQAWNAAFLEIGVAITYGLLDVAAAIREPNHG